MGVDWVSGWGRCDNESGSCVVMSHTNVTINNPDVIDPVPLTIVVYLSEGEPGMDMSVNKGARQSKTTTGES